MHPVRRTVAALAIVASLAVGAACLPFPPHGVVVIALGPPPPRWEPMGPPPGPGYVWVSGYWAWRSRDFFWVGGQWRPIPPGHRYWVPGHWVHTRRGWYFVEGYWD